jgi:hypothetical protein
MLPSTSIFVLLMANDREALGPWVNARWLNALAVVIIAILVVLSVTMMVSTLFTSVNVVAMLEWTGAIVGVGVVIGLPIGLHRQGPRATYDVDRLDWRMPRVALLERPKRSRARRWLLMSIATYLSVAGTLLLVRIIQLATS